MKITLFLISIISFCYAQEIFLERDDIDMYMIETDYFKQPSMLFGVSCNFVEDYSFFTFKNVMNVPVKTDPARTGGRTYVFNFCGPLPVNTDSCNVETLASVTDVNGCRTMAGANTQSIKTSATNNGD